MEPATARQHRRGAGFAVGKGVGGVLRPAQLQSTATARQGAAIDLTYKIRLKPDATPLQLMNEINRLEGIQNLELKRS